ncbi:MAG: quinone-dependent dihydroorotate dehydrogenase [Rhodospirillaceae bacterium]
MVNPYALAWPVLRRMEAEDAHNLAIKALKTGLVAPLFGGSKPDPASLKTTLWGRCFPNPIGVGAGFDKNAEVAPALARLGFGFVEVGTVTPRPQPGNPKPRLFRLTADQAVINRMGFNNAGMEAMAAHLQTAAPRVAPAILGVNVGRNKDTTDDASDYAKTIHRLARYADYLTINVSSPNTPGLRALQGREPLTELIRRAREALAEAPLPAERTMPPLLLKIAPDLVEADLADIAAVALDEGLDGLICTNTTISRPDSLSDPQKGETGGLSGAPLTDMALQVLRRVYQLTEGRLPLIGVGGIGSGAEAYARIRAGASLVQIYSALVYGGPGLVGQVKTDLAALLARDGFATVSEAVGVDAN